jgi:hypothetical protein
MNLYDSNTSNSNQNLVIKLTSNTKTSLNNNSSSNSSSNIQTPSSSIRPAPIKAVHISSIRQATHNVASKIVSSSKSSFNSNSTSKMATSIVQPLNVKRTSMLQKSREPSANTSSSVPRPQQIINNHVISASSSRGMSAGRLKR